MVSRARSLQAETRDAGYVEGIKDVAADEGESVGGDADVEVGED